MEALSKLVTSGSLQTEHSCRTASTQWLLQHFDTKAVYLNPSCTDALEMTSLILNLEASSEVIVPSYTYVSTANAFRLRTPKITFADCLEELPVVDLKTIEPLVSRNTKAIVVMHYAGISVDMDPLIQFCQSHGITLIEDAAHAFGARYKLKSLGTLGSLSCFSFHYTKILSCGEGGCLLVNDESLVKIADEVFEKGTNRTAFQQKRVNRYEWLRMGSSFAMSSLQSCVLQEQLKVAEKLVSERILLWNRYMELLAPLQASEYFELPRLKAYHQINGAYFYLVLPQTRMRSDLQIFLSQHGIESAAHYPALHLSPFAKKFHNSALPNAEKFENCLLRLPIFNGMTLDEQLFVSEKLTVFFKNNKTF